MHCPNSTPINNIVQGYIQQNLERGPGIVPSSQLVPITTDMDNFPYPRFYRGLTTCTQPRIFDREAGHRPWRQELYRPAVQPSLPPPFEGCFQIPCSTILPCTPDSLKYKHNASACVYISP